MLNNSKIIKVQAPKKVEITIMRILVFFGVFSVVVFLTWFFSEDRVGYAWLYWPLTIAFLFKILKKLHEWYHYYSVSTPEKPDSTREWKVDILTTSCPGEPHEMIITTLKAMQAITYPHTSYLCDEGDDPVLKKVCEELGVVHVTRKDKVNAKAGNINNALKQASGEICIILDPDHIPRPEMLDQLLPYFEDPKIGYVQSVQGYHNHRESLIALGAAEQTYHFYGPMMMAMNTYGTVQAIGANCAFRRAALDSIGGHAAGLAEDMNTAMQLHAKGWKAVYVPEMLTKGLVPSSLSGYYKQQLKWSRGTFDLLFYTFPKLFSKFTFRQKLHYFTLPLHFLAGLITLIDIAVPVSALFLSEVPWLVDFSEFCFFCIPVIVMSLLIRMFSQRWLLERHERGFHIVGGLLRIGTWWVFMTGLIYTFFRIKVPYIPTPKDDTAHNDWKLSMPNILVVLLSISAIIFGLYRDWSPYSFCMATFAAVNSVTIGYVVLIGQQKLLEDTHRFIRNTWLRGVEYPARLAWWYSRQSVYFLLRHGSLAIAFTGIFFLLGYTMIDLESANSLKDLDPPKEKQTGGFYAGIYQPELDKGAGLAYIIKTEKQLGSRFSIVSFYIPWGTKSVTEFPSEQLRQIKKHGAIPMITWEPWLNGFGEAEEKKVFRKILEGKLDSYIENFALKIKEYKEPALIRFAHEPDNPQYPWSPTGGNSPEEFKRAFKYVVNVFDSLAVGNISWIYNPLYPENASMYYPGDEYVDWVGITCLNYGKASHDGNWKSFEELYKPFRKFTVKVNKPIMLAEFGCTTYGGKQGEWFHKALSKIKEYPEIRGTVLFNTTRDKNWITSWRPNEKTKEINWSFESEKACINHLAEGLKNYHSRSNHLNETSFLTAKLKSTFPANQANVIRKSEKGFTLISDGKPFYIKGIAYNLSHNWRDEEIPLSRSRLTEDFSKIKWTGANTIRRYGISLYDRNIFQIAEEQNLKIIFGFWFDPSVDYYKDSAKVLKYIRQVEETVNERNNEAALLAWCLGDQTWDHLKHFYAEPYLSKVRRSFLHMTEVMAREIKKADPDHPVILPFEHSNELPFALESLRILAPSIDVAGVNSFYEQRLSELAELTDLHFKDKPYLVTSFGPRGFWEKPYSKLLQDTIIIEDSDFEKAVHYAGQWKNYIEAEAGKNLGGVAFCWRDRMEGTATWSGITDYKGRMKPSFFALHDAFTGTKSEVEIFNVMIAGPSDVIPGKTYQYQALTDNILYKDCTYEWQFRKEDYLDAAAYIKEIDNGRKIEITIPENPSVYRLYLYVSDDEGKVVTASIPIPVRDDEVQ